MKYLALLSLSSLIMFSGCASKQAAADKIVELKSIYEDAIQVQSSQQPLDTGLAEAQALVDACQAYVQKWPEDTANLLYEYWTAAASEGLRKYEQALVHFDKVWETDPNHRKAPIARYRAALVTEVFMNDLQAAYTRYEGFLKAYPDHEFAESAELQLKYVGDPDGLLDAVLEEAGQETEAPE